MIDIIFLLLIFFLVAGQWRPEENILPFKLPVADAGLIGVGKPEPMVLKISKTQAGCAVQIGQGRGVEISDKNIDSDLGGLMKAIEKHMRDEKRFASDPIEIVCGGEVKWEQVAKIYNMLYGAGASDITFTMTE
jgi:biopolymer transport protein ExbD